MKIIIDIHHPADINFFRNAINILIRNGITIELTVRPRGNIVSIMKKELPNIPFKIIGMHYVSIHKKIFYCMKREIELLFFLKQTKFDVGIAFGPEICYVSRLLGKPSIAFTDDFEYKLSFYSSKFAASRFIIPDYIPVTGTNVHKFKGLKELAYLHPKYFKPNKNILKNFNLNPYGYVFIREVVFIIEDSNSSLNHQGSSSKLHEIVQYFEEIGFQVVMSLEDKTLIQEFKDNCIVLKEPVEDFHSLLSFAALTISSGDTVARESCLVGTPAIYTGGRNMSVNSEFIKKECMFMVNNALDLRKTIKYIIENNLKSNVMKLIDYDIKNTWDDVTEVIVKNIMTLEHPKKK